MLQPRRIDRTGRPRNEEFDMRRGSAFSRFAGGRRTIVGGVTIMAAMTIAMASAGIVSARSDSAAVREPVGNTPGELDASICGFPIHVGVVSDKEYVIHSSTLSDGTVNVRFTGTLVERFTNTDTGKSVTENVGGPATLTIDPNGVVTFDGQGLAWFWFDAVGRAATGQPGLVFTAGHAVDRFGPGIQETFSLSGRQVDGCQLLAG
jgi:hypothetical protein